MDQAYRYKIDHAYTGTDGNEANLGIINIETGSVDTVLSREEMIASINADKAKLSNFGRSPGSDKEALNYYTYGKSPPLKTW